VLSRLLPLPALFAAAVLTAGCSGGSDTVKADVPKPPAGKITEACAALMPLLPAEVMDEKRRTTSPKSELTAAWGGSPATVLRCGVPKPESLRPADPLYDPEQNVAGVNGVDWTFRQQKNGVVFTTLHREANIEVFVPKRFGQPTAPLVDLADAVSKAVPSTMAE
jgi:hypothetical protein